MFSDSVAVGQACTQAPQDTHSESMNGTSWLAATFESKPRPWMVSARVPCCSSQARTQREQTMHLLGIEGEIRVARVLRRIEVVRALVAVAHLAQAHDAGHVLQFAMAVGGAGQAVERVIGDIQLHHAAAHVGDLLVLGVTFMPCATGVVHEAGRPFMPSICTRHRRQEPKASSCSVAHSFGIFDLGERRGAHHRGALPAP